MGQLEDVLRQKRAAAEVRLCVCCVGKMVRITQECSPLIVCTRTQNYKQAQASLVKELEGMLEAKEASLEVRYLSILLT